MPRVRKAAASSTRAKATASNTAFHEEDESPKAGDNAKPVPTAAQIASAVTDIMKKQSAVTTAAAFVAAAFKTWEKSCGISKKLLRQVIADMNLTEDEAEEMHSERTRYMIAAGLLPVADDHWTAAVRQTDILGLDPVRAAGEPAEELRHQVAYKHGHAAGRKNKPLISNPYSHNPGSIEFVGWRDGHGEGLKLRNELNPEKATTVHADDSRARVEPDEIGEAVGSA